MTTPDKPGDPLGIRPAAEALRVAVETAQTFLERICGPAADELGLMLKDRVGHWRMMNALSLVAKAKARFADLPNSEESKAHPRLVMKVINEGSWSDEEDIQEMWAGLLASSRSDGGRDDSNLIFINLLNQLTAPEARIMSYLCERVEKVRTESGVINANWLHLKLGDLHSISGIDDLHRLDRELDHLRALELTEGGIPVDHPAVGHDIPVAMKPTGLGLNLFVRCQGATESPITYFALDDSGHGAA